jgi:deoxyadenosine/deoxycytidine kinase
MSTCDICNFQLKDLVSEYIQGPKPKMIICLDCCKALALEALMRRNLDLERLQKKNGEKLKDKEESKNYYENIRPIKIAGKRIFKKKVKDLY